MQDARDDGLIQIGVTSIAEQHRDARQTLRDRLARQGIDSDHIFAVEAVANEMLGAAFDSGVTQPLILSVELSTTCTTVRVRCPTNIELHHEPFGIRARVLEGLANTYGKHQRDDGSIELWAELAGTVGTEPA